MSYVKPAELVTSVIDAGVAKVMLSTRDTIVRSILGGALLTLHEAPCRQAEAHAGLERNSGHVP